MQFLKDRYSSMKKTAMHYLYPNQNPNTHDKLAFDLLDRGEVDQFIDHMEKNKVNINVKDWNTASLLIKAQDVANNTSTSKKLIPEPELAQRAIKAVKYLLSKGVNIDYQDKNGSTALLCAVHWGNIKVAAQLLERGADPNLGNNAHHFYLNPLLSATNKSSKQLIVLLISHGADIQKVFAINQQTKGGFRISQQQQKLLQSASNIAELVKRRHHDRANKTKSVLAGVSDLIFQEICFYA